MEQELGLESSWKDVFRIDFFDNFFKFVNGLLAQLSVFSDQGCVLAYVVSPLGQEKQNKSNAMMVLNHAYVLRLLG